jgi:hypothetical protein
MILGKTPAGAIKIKSDGGLRAVNCACCGGCGCDGVAIPSSLREFADNATINSITIFGIAPDFLTPFRVGFWYANFGGEFDPLGLCEILYEDGCLYTFGPYIEYSTDDGETVGLAKFGPIDDCIDPQDAPGTSGTFTINGVGEYPYYYLSSFPFVPPPNFVFNDPSA